jgi:integrase
MFNLAFREGRIASVPHIPKLEENNAREGFVGHAEFLAVIAGLPDYLKDPLTFLYLSAWRPAEMRTLQWRDVDLPNRIVRLRSAFSKNKQGRVLPLSGELLEVIKRAEQHRTAECPLVFHRNGNPIREDLRDPWRKACHEAGVDGLLVYDFRRSAIRNMVRAGVPERVAMSISGHKTRSVFDRYNIVSEDDLRQATQRVERYLSSQAKQADFPSNSRKLSAFCPPTPAERGRQQPRRADKRRGKTGFVGRGTDALSSV